jgi:hypothetical protein
MKITRQKKPVLKLRDALVQNKLAFPILVLIEQQKYNIVFGTETSHLKLLGDLYLSICFYGEDRVDMCDFYFYFYFLFFEKIKRYDKTQETLIQFSEFLSTNMPTKDYAALLPNAVELCQKYNMEPETAFHISRPVLSLLYVRILPSSSPPPSPLLPSPSLRVNIACRMILKRDPRKRPVLVEKLKYVRRGERGKREDEGVIYNNTGIHKSGRSSKPV